LAKVDSISVFVEVAVVRKGAHPRICYHRSCPSDHWPRSDCTLVPLHRKARPLSGRTQGRRTVRLLADLSLHNRRSGQALEGERARPLQTLIWYPAIKSDNKAMTVGDYGISWPPKPVSRSPGWTIRHKTGSKA